VSRAEVKEFLATGRVGPYEKEYFRKDGTRKWFLFAGSSLGDDQCVEFCVDISERKTAEEALRRTRQRLTWEMAAGHSTNFDWDAKSNTNTWSDELPTLYGLKPEEFGGRYRDRISCLVLETQPGEETTFYFSLPAAQV
jgi:PAS domain-containing protein